MDTFNEQQLSMCETNELVDYIGELRVENDNLKQENEELKKQLIEKQKELITKSKIDLLKTQEIEKLVEENKNITCVLVGLKHRIQSQEDENEKLKNPVIYDRDMRCSQLDMRIGYSFLHDFLEPYDAVIEESIVKDQEEYVWSEVSRCISNAIEEYIHNPIGEINSHIVDEVGECYAKLDTQGCFKEVEDE